MLFFLVITLICITLAVLMAKNQRVVSPGVLFMVPFTISAFFLLLNTSRWSVVLHVNTYLVIVGGCLSFLLGVVLAKRRYFRRRVQIAVLWRERPGHAEGAEIPDWFLWVALFVQLVFFAVCLRAILSVARSYGYSGTLAFAIYQFRNTRIYTTDSVSLGRIREWMYAFNLASGYIWMYMLAFRASKKQRIPAVLVLNIIICLATGLLKGSRQSSVQMIVAGITYYFLFYIAGTNRSRVPLKKMIKPMLLLIVIAVTFQMVGTLLGRTVRADFMQYIAVYLSGSIRNLNEWLQSPHSIASPFGKMTVIYFWNTMGNYLHVPGWVYVLDLPYLSANGNNSGNVYTLFYAYIYDFGYIGAAVVPFIIGFISQLVFKKTSSIDTKSERNIQFNSIIYGYIAYTLAFSYFSNKFFEGIVRIGFVRMAIVWALYVILFNRFRFVGARLLNKRIAWSDNRRQIREAGHGGTETLD